MRFGLSVQYLSAAYTVLLHPGRLAAVGTEIVTPLFHRIDLWRLSKPPQLSESWLGLETLEVECRQSSEIIEQPGRLVLVRIPRKPADESVDCINQVDIEPAIEIGSAGARLRVMPLQVREVLDQPDHPKRIMLGEHDNWIVGADLSG